MGNYTNKMFSTSEDVSLMRICVFICVINAVWISNVALVMWVISKFYVIKSPLEVGSIVGLCGTFLSPLIPKAIQSFAENRKKKECEELEEEEGEKK